MKNKRQHLLKLYMPYYNYSLGNYVLVSRRYERDNLQDYSSRRRSLRAYKMMRIIRHGQLLAVNSRIVMQRLTLWESRT